MKILIFLVIIHQLCWGPVHRNRRKRKLLEFITAVTDSPLTCPRIDCETPAGEIGHWTTILSSNLAFSSYLTLSYYLWNGKI